MSHNSTQEIGKVWNFTWATPLLHQVRAKHPTLHIATVQQALNTPGACQPPHTHKPTHMTRCLSSTYIANTYAKCSKHSQHRVPVKHHNIPLPHIDQSRGVIVTNNLQWRPTPHSPIRYTKIYPLHLLLHMQHLSRTYNSKSFSTHLIYHNQCKFIQANGMTRDHWTPLSTHDVCKDGECHRPS